MEIVIPIAIISSRSRERSLRRCRIRHRRRAAHKHRNIRLHKAAGSHNGCSTFSKTRCGGDRYIATTQIGISVASLARWPASIGWRNRFNRGSSASSRSAGSLPTRWPVSWLWQC